MPTPILDEPRTVVVPFRWQGHGIDVHAVLDGPDCEPRFSGPDIFTALRTVDDNRDLLTAAEVEQLVRQWPDEHRLNFLDWFDGVRSELVDGVIYAIATQQPLQQNVDVDDHRFSVAEAAEKLSRDPGIRISRDDLFAVMWRDWQWVEREKITGTWIPTASAQVAGWLHRDVERGRRRRAVYPQIRVTPIGLELAHHRLGGIASLSLDDDQPTLIEPTA